MRALVSTRPGGPDTLAIVELPAPPVGRKQVQISVRACGINYPDTLIIEDRYQFKPTRPFSPGGEVAGVVTIVGQDVTSVKVGDHVIGTSLWGGLAEKFVCDEHRCVPIPNSMAFDDAAALLLTFGTSYYGLKDRAQLQANETVIVLGAAGGIGLASVALAKAMGARVIAAVSTTQKAELAQDAGASEAVIYGRDQSAAATKEFTNALKRASGPQGADVIVDAVGGSYAEAALRAIGWNGRYLVVGFPAGIPSIPLNLPLLKSCQIIGVFWGAWIDREPLAFQQSAGELIDLYRGGKIKPVISARYSLEDATIAFEQLRGRSAVGKLVVTL